MAFSSIYLWFNFSTSIWIFLKWFIIGLQIGPTTPLRQKMYACHGLLAIQISETILKSYMMITFKYKNNGAQPSSANKLLLMLPLLFLLVGNFICNDVCIYHIVSVSHNFYSNRTFSLPLAIQTLLTSTIQPFDNLCSMLFFFLNQQNSPSRSWLFHLYMKMCNMHCTALHVSFYVYFY